MSQQVEAVIERIHKIKTDGDLDSSKAVSEVVFVKPSLFCRMKAPQNLGKVQRKLKINIKFILPLFFFSSFLLKLQM